MYEEVRKTVRFSKEEIDFIMNEDELKGHYCWDSYKSTFSVRLRNMIELYKQQKQRIECLVKQNWELSDERARLSDKSDIKTVRQGISEGKK